MPCLQRSTKLRQEKRELVCYTASLLSPAALDGSALLPCSPVRFLSARPLPQTMRTNYARTSSPSSTHTTRYPVHRLKNYTTVALPFVWPRDVFSLSVTLTEWPKGQRIVFKFRREFHLPSAPTIVWALLNKLSAALCKLLLIGNAQICSVWSGYACLP